MHVCHMSHHLSRVTIVRVTCRRACRRVSQCIKCQMSPCGSHRVCRKSSCMSRAVMRVTRLCPRGVQSQCVCVCGATGRDTIHIACDVIIQVMCHGAYHMSSIRVMYVPIHISQGIMSCMRIIAHITRHHASQVTHVDTHHVLMLHASSTFHRTCHRTCHMRVSHMSHQL